MHQFKKWLAAALILFVVCVSETGAQWNRSSFDDLVQRGKGSTEDLQSTLLSSLTGTQMAVESAVDPASYHVGPGDQYILAIPILSDIPIPVLISYDNIAILPRGITIDVSHRTLTTFRAAIDSAYEGRRGQYGGITIALMKPRLIEVTVTGDVASPGVYTLTSAHRVSGALNLANNTQATAAVAKLSMLQNILADRGDDEQDSIGLGNVAGGRLSPRFVTIRRQNGEIRQVDLIRYHTESDGSENPHLREGDVLVVHQPRVNGSAVAVLGAVNIPAVVPYAPGDNALMLLRLAAWMRRDADSSGVYLYRQGDSGLVPIQLDPRDTAMLARQLLQPGDQLIVSARKRDSRPSAGAVAVTGEVIRPSVQPIIPGATTIAEVLEDAGGITGEAMPEGAFIMRMVEKGTHPGSRALEKMQLSSRADSLYLLQGDDQQQRIAVDLRRLVRDGDQSQNIVLHNGDRIVVPRREEGVMVRGQVVRSGWIAFRNGAGVEHYVSEAGGYAAFSDKAHTLIRKAGSDGWNLAENHTIGPGDEIYVPIDPPIPPRTSLETANTFVSITGALVSITLAILYFVRGN